MDGDVVVAVPDHKFHHPVRGTDNRTKLDQTPDAQARAGIDFFLDHFGRAIKKHDGVIERIKHQADSQREHRAQSCNRDQAAGFARHLPRPLPSPSSRPCTVWAASLSASNSDNSPR